MTTKGYKQTPEHIEKRFAAARALIPSAEELEEIKSQFDSREEAAAACGVHKETWSKWCKMRGVSTKFEKHRSGRKCRTCGVSDSDTPFPDKGEPNHLSCRKCLSAEASSWKQRNPDKALNAHLKRTYKKSLVWYNETLAAQGYVCLLCRNPDIKQRLSVDHDRSCCGGTTSCGLCVRGLLCGNCNRGLGHFKDDIDILRRAIGYLEQGINHD